MCKIVSIRIKKLHFKNSAKKFGTVHQLTEIKHNITNECFSLIILFTVIIC